MNDKLVEVGLIIAGSLDQIDESAVQRTVADVTSFVKREFPDLRWHFVQSRRPESVTSMRAVPSVLLQQALDERDQQHWDFAFVVTSAELASYYSTHCFACLSRPLDAAVFSLSLIDPRAIGQRRDAEERTAVIARRLTKLWLHALGHLLGLSRESDPANLLYHPANIRDLDHPATFSEEQYAQMSRSLMEIADQRLEERSVKMATIPFTIRSTWINAREIVEGVVAARPWEFPRRLSGLTLAAVSTLVILLMTAESWDLALSQTVGSTITLMLACWAGATSFVVYRQQLFLRNRKRNSEQIVVTNITAVGIVLAGMIITWMALCCGAFLIASLLFGPELISAWAGSSHEAPAKIGFGDRLQTAAFNASLGIIIGALGSSFEAQHYFRHVIFVDEEL